MPFPQTRFAYSVRILAAMQGLGFLCAFIAGIGVLAMPALAQVVNEEIKIKASDGAVDDVFGEAVSISEGLIAVGAPFDDDNGNLSGSAYLFDAVSGSQLMKILPSDGAVGDEFGWAIDMSDGLVAIGAPLDDDNGSISGSAYIFDALTGAQVVKLLPSDGAMNDFFGRAIAIENGIVVVGAYQNDDLGNASGSAYLFNATTGVQITKLLPNDGERVDLFGISVAIGDGVVAIGASNDRVAGVQSGSVYLFDASTGLQFAKLAPADGGTRDKFGVSVAISNNIVVVGASEDDDNGTDSGSVYIFDIAGTLIAKVLASNGAAGDAFGHSVAINNGVVAVGAWHANGGTGSAYLFDAASGAQTAILLTSDAALDDEIGWSVTVENGVIVVGADGDDDNGSWSGSAYVFGLPDTDGDGLADIWETDGIPYVSGDGFNLRYMLPGADPTHKDLYIEVDSMAGFGLSSASVTLLQSAFSNSPVTNPDGFDGINLHILRDESVLPLVPVWQTDGCWPLDFNTVRAAWYGTPAERLVSNPASLLAAKAKAYRYCIIGDKAGPKNIGGCGKRPGDNFVLYLGGGAYDEIAQAAVFMHELGHNLGLGHGGGDSINGKPNYPSIMNYVMSYLYTWNGRFWALDYSRAEAGAFATLDEGFLFENIGVGTPTGRYKDFFMPFGVNVVAEDGNTYHAPVYMRLNGSPNDFGDVVGTGFQDGNNFDSGIVQDLNYVSDAVIAPSGIPSTPSPFQVLTPHDDWGNIKLPLRTSRGLLGAPGVNPVDEITNEARLWINRVFTQAPNPCPADLNGDGILDTGDIQVFVVLFLAQDLAADLNGDGILDVGDIQAFVTLFLAGC